jgi:ubiquinone/menaquinone biosynthesis C-methylase UbiE
MRTAPASSRTSQTIYDSAAFFDQYSRLPRAQNGLEGASEWPLLKALLPKELTGLTVLDLGCGDGWFARWAVDQGAAAVLALDASKNMLERAQELTTDTTHSCIEFRQVDMQHLSLEEGTFDVIFSGLALHYPDHLDEVLQELHKSLKPGGAFVFSVEHPVFTAPRHPGFHCDELTGRTYWPLNDYFDEGNRSVSWLGAKVKKQHHMLQTWFAEMLSAGFAVVGLNEWGATDEECRKHPNWPEGVSPRFMVISARKTFRGSTVSRVATVKRSKVRRVVSWARRGRLLSRRLRMKDGWRSIES